MWHLMQSRRRQRQFTYIGGSILLALLIFSYPSFHPQTPSKATEVDKSKIPHEPLSVKSNLEPKKVQMESPVAKVVTDNTQTPTKKETSKFIRRSFPEVRVNETMRRFRSSGVDALIGQLVSVVENKEIAWLFGNCFPNTLDTTLDYVRPRDDNKRPDTYVITGDIDAMWLRDSSAQVSPYLPLIKVDKELRQMIEGVILRQSTFIQRDPYANAHYKDETRVSEWKRMDQTDMRPGVHERKWELDSLCYYIRLMHSYWKEVGPEKNFFTDFRDDLIKTLRLVLATMKEQQRFNGSGPYSYQRQGHPADPHGIAGKPNGLIHSFFRPSDDLQQFPYLIPSQFFAYQVLNDLIKLAKEFKWPDDIIQDASKLISDLDPILFDKKLSENEANIITQKHPKYGLMFAYEIDGFGHQNLMDDSNIPSLLSLPYLCPDYIPLNHTIYQNTRKFILSTDNPWFFRGSVIEGNGGPHVGHSMAWPLAITMRAFTATTDDEIKLCLDMLQKSHGDTGFMHESINVNNPKHFTRSWFAWANSLFGELVWKVYKEKPHLLNM